MRGKRIVSGVFLTSITQEAGFGTRTTLTFVDIRDSKGNLITERANMKRSKMGKLIWYKKGQRYRFKLCEGIRPGEGWMWHPVMIEDQNVRYTLKTGNNVIKLIKSDHCIYVTENYTAIDKPKKRYTLPLSDW